MKGTSPTQRSLKLLREQGAAVAVVEHWNPWSKTRQDLFGFADLLVLDPRVPGVTFVQVCAGSSHAARRAKLLPLLAVRVALEAQNRVEITSWSKKGPRGKRKVWTARTEAITLDQVRAQSA